VLNVEAVRLTDDQFARLCRDNPELRIEMSAGGELIFMPLPGGKTGHRNLKILQRLANCAEQDGAGLAFSSNTGFMLPNGAKRGPDSAWIRLDRRNRLAPTNKKRFPRFVRTLSSNCDHRRITFRICTKK
jgi:Uma2 family endonuclease